MMQMWRCLTAGRRGVPFARRPRMLFLFLIWSAPGGAVLAGCADPCAGAIRPLSYEICLVPHGMPTVTGSGYFCFTPAWNGMTAQHPFWGPWEYVVVLLPPDRGPPVRPFVELYDTSGARLTVAEPPPVLLRRHLSCVLDNSVWYDIRALSGETVELVHRLASAPTGLVGTHLPGDVSVFEGEPALITTLLPSSTGSDAGTPDAP